MNHETSDFNPSEALVAPLEKLLGKLAEALSKAQKEIKPPVKTREVDFTDKNGRRVKYSYSDLSDLIECIREPLSKQGLAVTHQFVFYDGSYTMNTSLIHSSGQRLESFYPLPDPSTVRPQEMGSSITYARRYSLSSLLGIASEEDDDGAIAKPAAPKAPLPKPKIETPSAPSAAHRGQLSAAQLTRLFTVCSANNWTHDQMKDFMKDQWGMESTKELSKNQYDLLIETMESCNFKKAMDDYSIQNSEYPT